ncbi:MAG: hypothetical protein JO058_05820 [Alphaproteobacteria bacterium]|nr:hypothetical protein [Alphaproteobacteria bacterium]
MSVLYTDCGLKYVYLRNGYLLDGEGIVIRDPEPLHEAVAVGIITRSRPLRWRQDPNRERLTVPIAGWSATPP